MKIQTKYGDVHVLANCPLLDSTERLEFKTEVHEAYGGSEDRYTLRDAPRQILSFNYVNMQKALGDMFHMLYANLRNLWGIPLPQFRQLIPDLDDSDYIPLSTAANIADLRVGFALIESAAGFQVVEITAVGRYIITQEEIRDPETDEIVQALETEYQDGFRLAQNVTVSNASIMPLRICIIDGDASISTGGFWLNSSVVFRVLAEDSPEHSGDIPAQYQGEDIYFKPLLLDGSALEMTLMQHQNIVDADVGGFQQFTHWKKPRYLKPFKSVLKGWDLYSEYRRFLFRRMGRYQAFWMPLYEKHLNILNTGNITTSLSTNTRYLLEADRKHIAVKRKNGMWTAHEITAKTGGSLTVSPAINAHRNDIQTICYLGLYRFDADQIEFQFLGAQITQVTVPIVELSS
ncbi:hypothetical protein BEN74_03915 [Acinetobacter sp. WCHAc010034]|uniref:hypothetical protein n=1 Tax=Acinetobacter sp. WCHAc010034 TaxID=1879049 RepID=UPI00083A97F7|nr:hypothetical protein [Acinetobacter sp. WCHAc010034]AYA02097.1 hypothetical protein BEN74_03915 [Acinetobacter sp. WCHAc010034]